MSAWTGAAAVAGASVVTFLCALGITALALYGLTLLLPAAKQTVVPIRQTSGHAASKSNRAA